MTNREILEYMKICTGKDIITDIQERLSDTILDSEVSIKRFLNATMNDIGCRDVVYMLIGVFHYIDTNKDKEEALNIITDVIDNVRKYMHKSYFKPNIDYICSTVTGSYGDITLDDIKEFKIQKNTSASMQLNNNLYYIVRGEKFGDMYSVGFIDPNNKHVISNIGAVIYKDDNYEMLKLENEEDKEKMVKRLSTYDYDLAITFRDEIRKR